MKAYIDRIEDGKTTVVIVEKYGELFVPVKYFAFPVREGMHLRLEWARDPESEAKTREEIAKLREKLLKKAKP